MGEERIRQPIGKLECASSYFSGYLAMQGVDIDTASNRAKLATFVQGHAAVFEASADWPSDEELLSEASQVFGVAAKVKS